MLSISKLELNNFVTYESEVLDFDAYFSESRLLLISGENQDAPFICDSNGAGKSLVYEALCWAVFGRTTRGGLKDSVIGKFSGSCSVFATISNTATGDIYEIRRYRKDREHGNNVLFFVNGEEQRFTIKTDVDKFIWHTLGVSYDKVINTCIFRSDDERKRFVYMGDVDRKRLLAEMRGTDIFPLCEKIASKKHKEAESSLDETDIILQEAIRQKRRLTHELKNLKEQAEAVATERQQRIDVLHKKKAEFLVEFNKKEEKLNKKISRRKTKLRRLKEKASSAKANEEDAKYNELEAKASKAFEELSMLKGDIARIDGVLEKASGADNVGAICDHCGNKITGWTLRKHIQGLNAEKKSLKARVKSASKRMRENHKKAKIMLAGMQETKEAKWQISSIKGEIATIEEQLVEAKNHYIEKRDAIDKQIVEEESSENPYGNLIDTHTESIAELTMQIGEQRCRITGLREELKYLWAWRTGYGREEIQNQALQGTVGKLNSSIRKISDYVTASSIEISLATEKFGAAKKLGNFMDLEIRDAKEDKARPFKEFSTGERKRIEIIFSLASLELDENIFRELFLDELFDGLDATGTKRVMRLLEEKAEEGRNIVVITHIPEISDHFDNVLSINRANGKSIATHMA